MHIKVGDENAFNVLTFGDQLRRSVSVLISSQRSFEQRPEAVGNCSPLSKEKKSVISRYNSLILWNNLKTLIHIVDKYRLE